MYVQIDNMLPPGRPRIRLDLLLTHREHSEKGLNDCINALLRDPRKQHHAALVNGLRRILPFMYRTVDEVISILSRYGLDFPRGVSQIPTSFDFQWAHTGEILTCVFFEEIEDAVVLTYKWRLNTTKNQHQFGMDLIAFDLNTTPPTLYVIAVKTTNQGEDGKTPSVVYDAINELKGYLTMGDKLDDDLEIIAANLHTDKDHRIAFLDWYDPYTQEVPQTKPTLVAVPAIVAEEKHWQDKYALPAIRCDFGVPGKVRVICIDRLKELVRLTYSREASDE